MGRRSLVEKEERIVMRIYKGQLSPGLYVLRSPTSLGNAPIPAHSAAIMSICICINKEKNKNKDTIPLRPRYQWQDLNSYVFEIVGCGVSASSTEKSPRTRSRRDQLNAAVWLYKIEADS